MVVLRLSLPLLFGSLGLHVLGETAGTDEVTADGVEHAVDIAAALSGGIEPWRASTYSLIETLTGILGKVMTSAMAACMRMMSMKARREKSQLRDASLM